MKAFFVTELIQVLLAAIFMFVPVYYQQDNLPTLELKRDEIMEKRYAASLAALRTADEAQTYLKLRTMTNEFISEINKLKPAYQQWYKALSTEEKKRLLYRSYTKRWLLLMQEIQFDEAIQRRFLTDLPLKREYENLQYLCNRAQEIDLAD
jgi:hypothetical protein